jgi:hypothetical protein
MHTRTQTLTHSCKHPLVCARARAIAHSLGQLSDAANLAALEKGNDDDTGGSDAGAGAGAGAGAKAKATPKAKPAGGKAKAGGVVAGSGAGAKAKASSSSSSSSPAGHTTHRSNLIMALNSLVPDHAGASVGTL